jgi:aldehyde dehydrogenase (NAD+)
VYIRNEPYGVAGQILPWNYPLNLFGWKAGAALAAGNTVVCKPSEEAPLSITRAAQLSAGVLPDGVLNVVNGYGTEAGAPLTEHGGVDKLSFTGSVPVGKSVMRAAAEHVTPVTLELGGKSPFVVFPDADIQQAAETSAAGIFYNTGQSCDACSRILVHEDVREAFTEAFLEAAAVWEPGDPLADGTTMGPLTFADQHQKVTDYIELGQQEGATLLHGGASPDGELAAGEFIEPTVFANVDNDMRIAQEEIFGPVQTIIEFADYEEAIELANDVDYGLAAGVATGDGSTAHRAAADIQAGSIWVNEYHGGGPGIPFGGFKASGIGRECAKEALDEYTQTKSVNIALDDPRV